MDAPEDETDDLEFLLKEALIKLVSEQSKDRLAKLCKNILNELQNEYEQSIHNATNGLSNRSDNGLASQSTEQELEHKRIDELERMHMDFKINVETKKDALFNQSTIKYRLLDRLTKIYELIERNKEKINQFFNSNDNDQPSIDLLLDEYIDRWNEDKQRINDKFQLIDQLLNELNLV